MKRVPKFMNQVLFGTMGDLEHINVHSTNLSSVIFSSKIPDSLDLSNNNLESLDFLFTPKKFNQFKLSISKNKFSCEYLAEFLPRILRDWPKLKSVNNPLKQKNCTIT